MVLKNYKVTTMTEDKEIQGVKVRVGDFVKIDFEGGIYYLYVKKIIDRGIRAYFRGTEKEAHKYKDTNTDGDGTAYYTGIRSIEIIEPITITNWRGELK